MHNKPLAWFEWATPPFYQTHAAEVNKKQPPTTNPSAELELRRDLDLTPSFARDFLRD